MRCAKESIPMFYGFYVVVYINCSNGKWSGDLFDEERNYVNGCSVDGLETKALASEHSWAKFCEMYEDIDERKSG